MWRLHGLGGVELRWTDGWVICFLAYWCWYPVMFALAAFRRALPLKLACSFPPLHSHAVMRALAFTLHPSSPLSPTRTVSSHAAAVVRAPRHSSTLFSFLSFLPSDHPPAGFTYTFSPSSLFPLTFSVPSPCCPPHLLSSISYNLFLLPFPQVFIFLSLFHPCQPAALVSIGFCCGGIEWIMMVLLVLRGCRVFWPGKAQMPYQRWTVDASVAGYTCVYVCVFLCMCVVHRSLAGRDNRSWLQSHSLAFGTQMRVESRQNHSSPCRRLAETKFLMKQNGWEGIWNDTEEKWKLA